MAWWIIAGLVVVVFALGACAYALRPIVFARRTERALALPLALIERACTDAVEELVRAAAQEKPLFVSPFDPTTYPIARVPKNAIAQLGDDAPEEHEKLVVAMQRWNAAAGTRSSVERLLPTLLVAHEAAQRLAKRIEGHALDLARQLAERRVLLGLVAEPPEENAVVH